MRKRARIQAIVISAAFAVLGCGEREETQRDVAQGHEPATTRPAVPAPRAIEVEIAPRSGSELRGTATFEPRAEGVLVRVVLQNAPPGLHAVHVHESADCSAADASSAGEHFNPEKQPHGIPPSEPRHLGDLGNIEVTGSEGRLEMLAPGATLARGDARSFDGRAIIVHAKEDSGAQPSGDAGDRIGCGEIRAQS
jgi:superoxide dismutase, Cu-Zn family